jgi:mannonate dehydratase
MYLGTQLKPRNDDDYRVWAQLGVNHICGWPETPHIEWTETTLSAYREKVESFGLTVDILALPLSSASLGTDQSRAELPHIILGKSPERDRDIDHICDIIRACSKAGIPAVKYNMNIIGIPRTKREEGRGGSSASAFRWEKANQDEGPTIAGEVSADEFWERIDYFLERVVPVAEEYRIRMACHPHDPYTPPGYRGVDRVLGTVDGLKRLVRMHENPYHGLNFCQGSITEMMDNPSVEIFDVIRWFGERKKIFLVHFRNIRGKKLDFVETFPDEGDVDMLEAARVYKEVGYPYMLVPDHEPWIAGENQAGVAFAFAYGHTAAILQTVNAE